MADFEFGIRPQTATATQRVEERPFILGLMADLSGEPAEPLAMVTERRFLAVDVDNVDDRMRAVGPRVAFEVANAVTGEGTIAVDLTFADLDDFGPAAVASKVELLSALRDGRARLAAMRSGKAESGASARELLGQAISDPLLVDAIAGSGPAPEVKQPEAEAEDRATPEAVSELERLLGRTVSSPPKPTTSPLQGLFEQAAAGTPGVSDQTEQTLGLLIDRIDELMGRQLDAILHHDAFRALEATWRGLHFLLERAETDDGLTLRVLNASKAELATMMEAGGMLGGNPLASRLKGEPYGALVGDYAFDHAAEDVALLRGLGEMASALGLSFIGGAAPSLLGLTTWRELSPDLDAFQVLADEAHAAWRELVDSEVSRSLILTMPRFLARLPYGRKTNPAEGLSAYQETAAVSDIGAFAWSNAAWAMAAVIASAASAEGWNATLTAGAESCQVGGLPCYAFTNRDGDSEIMCPTEVAMSVEFGTLLAKAGLAPLLHLKNTDRAVFVRVPTLGRRG
ncbi:MAG: type VI secretion system contractile sheath domain-containing protein [Planctomycetota bacterium]